MLMVSRAEAKLANLTRYFTGEPCPKGHVAERMVSNYACVVCSKDARKQLHATNQVADAQKNKVYRQANAEVLRAKQKARREADREAVLARGRRYAKEWRERNRELSLAQSREYHRKKPYVKKAANKRRRVSVKAATPTWFDEFDAFVVQQAIDLMQPASLGMWIT